MATSVKLDAELKSRLDRLAGERRRSSHWLMREAIRQYVEREEARESFKQEALESLARVPGDRTAPDPGRNRRVAGNRAPRTKPRHPPATSSPMPRVIVTAGAARGLDACRRFLAERGPEAAGRAGQAISRHLRMLETAPAMGRPVPEQPELRELVIGFGDFGICGAVPP